MKKLLILFLSLFFALNGYAYQHDKQSFNVENENSKTKNSIMCCSEHKNNDIKHSCDSCKTCKFCNNKNNMKCKEHNCDKRNHKNNSNNKTCCDNKTCSIDNHKSNNKLYIDKKYLEKHSKY